MTSASGRQILKVGGATRGPGFRRCVISLERNVALY